jgi:hypothetical protein
MIEENTEREKGRKNKDKREKWQQKDETDKNKQLCYETGKHANKKEKTHTDKRKQKLVTSRSITC